MQTLHPALAAWPPLSGEAGSVVPTAQAVESRMVCSP